MRSEFSQTKADSVSVCRQYWLHRLDDGYLELGFGEISPYFGLFPWQLGYPLSLWSDYRVLRSKLLSDHSWFLFIRLFLSTSALRSLLALQLKTVQNYPKGDFDHFSLSILWLLQICGILASLFPHDIIVRCSGKRHVLGEQRCVSQGCCPRLLSQVILGWEHLCMQKRTLGGWGWTGQSARVTSSNSIV